jgi:hypothetical protein
LPLRGRVPEPQYLISEGTGAAGTRYRIADALTQSLRLHHKARVKRIQCTVAKLTDAAERIVVLPVALFAFAIAASVSSGCSSVSPSKYDAPRVVGRVLDRQTHAPIKNVQVRRVDLMQQDYIVRTGADGAFVLRSERYLSVLGGHGWYSVTLSFERDGYTSAVQTYTLTNSTNLASGEPLVQAGDVLLSPK